MKHYETQLPRIVLGVIMNSQKQILLLKEEDVWKLPGGHIESRDPKSCLIRELKEEFGEDFAEKIERRYIVGFMEFVTETPNHPNGAHFDVYIIDLPENIFSPIIMEKSKSRAAFFPVQNKLNLPKATTKIFVALRKKKYIKKAPKAA